jgi:asparagine synthase (glutamine-hydrolysing)
MCGIAGWINLPATPLEALDKMLNLIRHRGPDDSQTYADREFTCGMVRLAINGISNGSQPLFSYSGKIALLYNGEIYNSPDLRSELEKKGIHFESDSDGEVICHLFEMEGPKAFRKLDGMFAAALWNREKRQLTLVRDLPGEKPLYYANHPSGGTVFASELKAFGGFPDMKFTLDRQSIADFPTFLWIPEPNTIFREVKALPCGHYLELSSTTQPKLVSYKQVSPSSPFLTEEETIHEIRKTVDRSIKARLLSEVPLGAFLSGGLDSSIIATQAARQLPSLTTFCIGFEAADDPYHGKADESSAAEETAKLIGSTHHTLRVRASDFKNSLESFCWHGDQPFAVSSGLGILHIAQKANAAGIKVMLSGDGADECFGGYSWYEHLALKTHLLEGDPAESILFAHDTGSTLGERLEKISGLNGPQRARAWHYYASEDDKLKLFNKDFIEGLQSSTRIFSEWKSNLEWSPEDFISQDRDCYLPFEMLRKVDRMTMAHSVEGRTPFTSPSVLAMANRIPYSMMTGPGVLKKTLRKAYADILPQAVTSRPKHGFNVPIDLWLKNEWSDLLQDAFSPHSALSKQGIIAENSAENALAMLRNPRRLNGHSLFCFIMLNLWLEQSYGNYC